MENNEPVQQVEETQSPSQSDTTMARRIIGATLALVAALLLGYILFDVIIK
jgi:hypothetical protein